MRADGQVMLQREIQPEIPALTGTQAAAPSKKPLIRRVSDFIPSLAEISNKPRDMSEAEFRAQRGSHSVESICAAAISGQHFMIAERIRTAETEFSAAIRSRLLGLNARTDTSLPMHTEMLEQISVNVGQNMLANNLLTSKKNLRDKAVFWRDETIHLGLKMRPDVIADDCLSKIVCAPDIQAAPFADWCRRHHLHVAAAMEIDGAAHAFADRQFKYLFIAVETTAPHSVAVYEAPTKMLAEGQEKYLELKAQVSTWTKTQCFPNSQGDQPAMLPW